MAAKTIIGNPAVPKDQPLKIDNRNAVYLVPYCELINIRPRGFGFQTASMVID
jgi:hypothetical protein